jgi:alpha-ketoglutarate-dependent 2,4-dichlorophenoxyacetate dioxygenase
VAQRQLLQAGTIALLVAVGTHRSSRRRRHRVRQRARRLPSLPEVLKRGAERLTVVHDFARSRDQVRPGFFTDKERAEYPSVRHPLVRSNPVNGRRALFLGAHASHVEGLPLEEGRALLRALLAHVTQPEFCYRHEWTEGDLVIWDNRCVLHRATPFDTKRHKRLMQRTTVSGDPAEPALNA